VICVGLLLLYKKNFHCEKRPLRRSNLFHLTICQCEKLSLRRSNLIHLTICQCEKLSLRRSNLIHQTNCHCEKRPLRRSNLIFYTSGFPDLSVERQIAAESLLRFRLNDTPREQGNNNLPEARKPPGGYCVL
jgi:hypothetical protein